MKFDTPITRDSVTRRSPSGERGLKYGDDDSEEHADDRRSPSGERGLKCVDPVRAVLRSLSLPIRGAWIEIRFKRGKIIRDGRSPSGERGLKYPRTPRAYRKTQSRSPSGERGLKSLGLRDGKNLPSSLPIRGAWIEMPTRSANGYQPGRSPSGERGLKFIPVQVRRADIQVAPHPGSVD